MEFDSSNIETRKAGDMIKDGSGAILWRVPGTLAKIVDELENPCCINFGKNTWINILSLLRWQFLEKINWIKQLYPLSFLWFGTMYQ